MISRETLQELEARGLEYILGARLRRQREVRIEVLGRAAVIKKARFDGKYVLCTNTTLPAAEVAVQYKRLYLVEQLFPRRQVAG